MRAVQVPSGNGNLDIFAGGNGKINFFKDSKGTQTKNYILIDNTSANANMTSTLTFANTSNATIGAIRVSSTGTGGNLLSTMQITNTNALNISGALTFANTSDTTVGAIRVSSTGTGANLLSTMQITNTNALNISGLGTLPASQVSTALFIDFNNNIVKGPTIYLNLNRTELHSTTIGYYINHVLVAWNIFTGALNLYSGINTNSFVFFLLINVNGNIPYASDIYNGWPINTNYNLFTEASIMTITGSSPTNTTIPSNITSKFIKFPTTGLYNVTLTVRFNTDNNPQLTIELIKNLTTFRERTAAWDNTISKVVGFGSSHTISALIMINYDASSPTPDTIAIKMFADSTNGGTFNSLLSYQLTINKIA